MIWLRVNKNSQVPMIRQIYLQIRERILSGRIQPGTRLFSSRHLATELAISRNVVLEAYDLLIAEGFLESRLGAGTYIAQDAMYEKVEEVSAPNVMPVNMGYDTVGQTINFRAGTPDLSYFPRQSWLKMIKKVLATPMDEILAYGHPEGRLELRQAICDYVVNQREVCCHPDQIVITAGTTQAIGIICHLLLGDNNNVILEDPITKDIQMIASGYGGVLHPLEVDDDGMNTSRLPEMVKPAFVYVTPSHQFPIGATLPVQRRIELLNYAEKQNCYVVEDDYDSEFRFDGPPLSSLHGLCPLRVIYIGTFSKTLCPAIRIGYLVLPPDLINMGRTRKWHSDLHNEVISQLALANFIQEGMYLKHLAKMRKKYFRRRKAVEDALRLYFPEEVRLLGSSTGLHLVAAFQGHHFTQEFLDGVESKGAKFYAVEPHAILPGRHVDKLLIGYGNLTRDEIHKGISILAESMQHAGTI